LVEIMKFREELVGALLSPSRDREVPKGAKCGHHSCHTQRSPANNEKPWE